MQLAEFLGRLDKVKGSGKQYTALCPAHSDNKQSLSVSVGDNGKILLNCHTGCTAKEIVNAMGLTMQDLFTEPPRKTREKNTVIATYNYTDKDGNLLNTKTRWSDKSFSWSHKENGKWKKGHKGEAVLYNLPAVASSKRIYVVEGEKDVETLKACQKVAVCSAHGAGTGKWLPQYTEALKGKEIVIIQDNDDKGKEFARETANALIDVAESVKVIDLTQEWDTLKEHGDISDVFEMQEAKDVLTKLEALETVTPLYEKKEKIHKQEITCLVNVEELEVKWLWYPYIPLGKITLLQADPGTGKTFLCLSLAATVSKGGHFYGEYLKTYKHPANVIYQTAEDGLSDTIKPRLRAMNPDFSKIFVINEDMESLTLSDERIEEAFKVCNPKLLIIDPLQAYLGADIDMHRANAVRPVLSRIAILAEKYECAVIFIMHMSKMSQSKALYRGLGSIDIPAVARSVLVLGIHPEDETKRIMCHEKSSLAKHGKSIIFHIDFDNGGVVFDEFCDIKANDILNPQLIKRGKPRHTLDETMEMLGELLGVEGSAKLKDIQSWQRANGVSEKTLYRAKSELALQTLQVGFSNNKETWWLDPDIDKEEFKRNLLQS